MRSAFLLGSFVIVLAAAAGAACTSNGEVTDGDDGGTGDETGGSTLPPETIPPGPAGSGLNTGLPCDVQGVLENRCIACHDGKQQVAMLSYDDLMKKSTVDPSKTIAQLAAIRMQSKTSPMPPPPAVPPEADEIQIFTDWVNAGTPKGAVCTDPPPPAGDAGPTIDAGADAGPVCTSGTKYNGGFGADMRPGEACNACHQVQGGPNLRIAGTVYPTLHEVDDCNGKKPPPVLTVTITDKAGKQTKMTANQVGNFSTQAKGIQPPFKATVSDGTKTRSMVGSVTSGDCNSCHTVAGKNSAPGRIMAP
jgi:hypothetical protein